MVERRETEGRRKINSLLNSDAYILLAYINAKPSPIHELVTKSYVSHSA
jgi:hypothetical protein